MQLANWRRAASHSRPVAALHTRAKPCLARTRPPLSTAQRTSDRPTSSEAACRLIQRCATGGHLQSCFLSSALDARHPQLHWRPTSAACIWIFIQRLQGLGALSWEPQLASFQQLVDLSSDLSPGLEHQGDFACTHDQILFVDKNHTCKAFSMRLAYTLSTHPSIPLSVPSP